MTLMTPDEAARHLSVSIRQLRDLTDDGLLRWINIGLGKKRATRRYTIEDLNEFIAERSQKCRSTKDPVKKPIPTTSSYAVVDFRAIRAQRKSERQSVSKTSSEPTPRRR
ncbi:helix-turn-helix domain-containing protein [Agrobacterium rhizogenes]|nr:helix-turn-helix domain-containing protein [Rhizobium rhizogenes]